jgi:hypothetical protein
LFQGGGAEVAQHVEGAARELARDRRRGAGVAGAAGFQREVVGVVGAAGAAGGQRGLVAKRSTQRVTAAGVASIRPRLSSPDSVSSASKVICARCTSNGPDRHRGLL